MRGSIVSGASDTLAGLSALFLFAVIDSLVHVGADLRHGVLVLALLCGTAGFARGAGRPENAWVKGLLIASGGSLALLLLGWNSIGHPVLAMLLLVAALFTIFGVRARRSWARQSAAKRAMTLLVPLAALIVFAVAAVPTLTSRLATRRVSVPAPEFSITTDDGSTIKAGGFRGRVVVLDFWATWCPACRREMPEMDKLYRGYNDDPRVSIWAVDVLNSDETVEKAMEFIKRNRYALPVAFINEESSKGLGIEGLPSLIIMDKSGRIRLFHVGFDPSEPLQSALAGEIEILLREPMP
jgi:thiol-disulfide isomerase/thioredoxin